MTCIILPILNFPGELYLASKLSAVTGVIYNYVTLGCVCR